MKETLLSIIIESLAVIFLAVVFGLVISEIAFADKYHHNPNITYLVPTPTVQEVTNVTEIVNTTNIENYTGDECQSVAIAQAGANNQMYMGTKKPQLSLGVGECNGEMASSLMFGMRVNNQLLLNGSYAVDESVNAFGFGATVIFK